MNILIVDDDASDVYFLRALLQDADARAARLTHTETLTTAAQRVQEEQFDIILLDFFLPGSQGIESLRRLREHAPDVPIVFLTGLKDDDLGRQMLEGGAQGTSSKGGSKARSCCTCCTTSLPGIGRGRANEECKM